MQRHWSGARRTRTWDLEHNGHVAKVLNIVSRCVLALAALTMAHLHSASALDVEFAARPIKREILALYDSRHEARPSETRLHRLAEMPLNWLGFKVTYADVNMPLPQPGDVTRYRAVVTWFIEPLQNPAATLAWLDTATAGGLRYICLGDVAPPEPPGSEVAVARILARLGLKATNGFVSVTHKSKITTLDRAMAGFERPVATVLPEFRVIEVASTTAKVHLAASVPDREGDVTSVLIATSPAGGYAADAFTIYYDVTADRARWTLNPFTFFKAAIGAERFPVPDVTTVSGRRMYFSHIDGDGWNNISEIEGYREAQVPASEVILREVIEPYPDLPVSVGLIAGDAVPAVGGSGAARGIAKKLFAMPQVEVASHTYTHPFAWRFFENYDRKAELAMIDSAAHPDLTVMDRVRKFLYRVAGKSDVADTQTRYVAGSADLPRGYLKEPFDLDVEVRQALDVSSELAPSGKKAAIYLWSGDAEPFEAAIRATRQAGVRNMNGGDSRFDAEFPSVFYVPPIARPVGAERQIYAANSNENTYTNNWHGPYYGQLALDETLKNTESPRRLKPFNLYYHMYSGEKTASLTAIKSIVNQARTSAVIPVKASEYAAIADDFFAAEIQQVDPMSWAISKRGALQTMRFDDASGIDIDDLKSSGVLGATRHEGAMYVALDASVEPAIVAIRTAPAETAAGVTPATRLVDSRWQLSGLKREDCGFSFAARGFGPGQMTWQTAPGQTFDIAAMQSGKRLYATRVASGADGQLEARIDADALEPVEVTFSCP